MSLELADFISQLVQSNPEGTDPKSRGDDHLRLLKHVLQTQFPNFNTAEPMTKTIAQLNSALVPGSFGIGGPAQPFTDANTVAGSFAGGLFFFQGAAGTGNSPPGSATGDTMLQIVTNQDLITQTWFSVVQAGAIHQRKWQGGAWTAWVPYWTPYNLPAPASLVDATASTFMRPLSFGRGVSIVAADNQPIDNQWGPFNFRQTSNSWQQKPGPPGATNGISDWYMATPGGEYGMQRFIDANNQREFRRFKLGNAWGPWAEIMGDPTAQVGGNPNCISLGPVNLHWGTTGAIGDEGTISVPFARSNGGMPVVVCQIAGAGISNVTFQDVYVSRTDPNGFDITYRTNGSNAINNVFWIAVALK